MVYCPANYSLNQPWMGFGLHQCFLSTVTCSALGFCVLLLIWMCLSRRFRPPIPKELWSDSKLWYLQLLIHFLMFVMVVVQVFTVVYTSLSPVHIFYGYLITELVVKCVFWLCTLCALYQDCTHYPSSERFKRHRSILIISWLAVFATTLLPLLSVQSIEAEWWWKLRTPEKQLEFSFWLIQLILVLGILVFGVIAPGLPRQNMSIYNSLHPDDVRPAGEGVWNRRFRRLKMLLPFIWPNKDRWIQFNVFICFLLLIVGRVINVYSPIFYKNIVDSLTPTPTNSSTIQTSSPYGYLSEQQSLFHPLIESLVGPKGLVYRWDYMLQYVAIRFLQGLGGIGGGFINSVRSQLWIKVDQYSSRKLSVLLFSHLHSLSLQWHVSRKTGEILRIMDRGTASITNILSYMSFNILPTLIDITIGVGYFVIKFNIWYGVLVFSTMVGYVVATIVVTEWRTKFRRDMNTCDNQKTTKAVDAFLNFETVKYFSAEQFEVNRFNNAFIEYQRGEWWTTTSLNLLNSVQNLIIILGLLVGTFLCARDVVWGILTVGDFVLFYSYILQLYSPLSLFGTYYRLIQTSFLDMENMFELLEQNADVTDDPDAPALQINGGELEFKHVYFHYSPERPILKDISFKVPPGCTVALVGQSGSGKSTIVRLLFRFYDIINGEILIDGQNIATVTQSSLRNAIGVVPQDTVLFNDTIKYNIRYGRRSATDDEVHSVAVSADIHNRVLEFPLGYESLVGERGLKLSGGEKQRVAIARNMLKNPNILVLDEATSALDTNTERNIQASLNVIASNRTTLIVAHRLSTIVHADEILMMHQGEIVERGTHQQLLEITNGLYAALWHAQVETRSSDESNNPSPTNH